MTLRDLLFNEDIDQVSLVEDCGSNDVSFALPGGEAVVLESISGCTREVTAASFMSVGAGTVDLAALSVNRLSLIHI